MKKNYTISLDHRIVDKVRKKISEGKFSSTINDLLEKFLEKKNE